MEWSEVEKLAAGARRPAIGIDASGVVRVFNARAEELTGKSAKEVVGRGLDSCPFFDEEGLARLEGLRQRTLADSAGPPVEAAVSTSEGTRRVLWTATIPGGEEGGCVFWGQDRTVPDEAREPSQESGGETAELVSILAHDLKGPLATINGFVRILESDCSTALSQKGRHCLERIRESAGRMTGIIESVMELAGKERQETWRRKSDLNDIMREVLGDLSEMVERCGARVEVAGALPVVRGDPVRLYQVFTNLVTNALKYMGGQPSPEVVISCARCADEVEIDIADNGAGIPAESAGEVFEMFKRVGETGVEGLGVGLALVKRIVERCGGRIAVDSAVGKGSTFSVFFPTGPLPRPRGSARHG